MSKELNETSADTLNQPPETKMKRLGGYMKETLKEMFRTLRHPEFKFAVSGIIITIVLILISLWFLIHTGVDPNADPAIDLMKMNLLSIPIGLLIAFMIIYLWFLLGFKITPRAAHYLVDNKLLKLFFTRGDIHYLEYIPVEKRKISMPHILNKYIALVLAWVSVSAFLFQLLANLFTSNDPGKILNPEDPIIFLLRTLVLFILVPLIFTLIYPLSWMLIDARLKAYNSASKLNWLVGTRVANLTGGFITIGSLVFIGADVLNSPQERGNLILGLVIFCLIHVSLIVILVSLFYNIFFYGKFYQRIIEDVEVGFGITDVTLVDEEGEALPKEPESKPEFELKPEPEPLRSEDE
ncbi:MAG: hypothetical protein ACFFB2_00290 [Promethearchaeota archaeon]